MEAVNCAQQDSVLKHMSSVVQLQAAVRALHTRKVLRGHWFKQRLTGVQAPDNTTKFKSLKEGLVVPATPMREDDKPP